LRGLFYRRISRPVFGEEKMKKRKTGVARRRRKNPGVASPEIRPPAKKNKPPRENKRQRKRSQANLRDKRSNEPLQPRTRNSSQIAFFTRGEVSELLKIHPRTVRRWIKEGLLVMHRIGGVRRILANDLRAFLARHRGAK
jgi:excisionase family DNA binding protein